ncbi:hypothetical protein [Planococcus faecalis]|uniref:hypothetical protein n=1 Tax=Planococcus faecalis TaxID=1598147 RepID=UPI0008DA1A94|nr:hypothetical protein [Planococcus faecalis]OHX52536.1 hypothetical protein BB777_03220 [Planococcus faecalis]
MYELIAIQDRSRWQKILDKLQITDIYYTSQYFLGALKLDPGEALLFTIKMMMVRSLTLLSKG